MRSRRVSRATLARGWCRDGGSARLTFMREQVENPLAHPESAIRSSFEALARGDAAAIVRLADPESLEYVRQARISISRETATALPLTSPQEFVERLLNGLPGLRASIRCQVIGHVLEGSETAHVLFRLGWGAPPVLTEPIHVATVRNRHGGWRLLLSPHSDWLLPGFENLLLSDEVGT